MTGRPADQGDDRPTMNAVVKYADDLRAQAEKRMAADPYARPYYPTTAGARQLARRIANDLERQTRDKHADKPDPVLEALVEDARANAPAIAIARLRERAALATRDEREDREQSERAAQRHARRQALAGDDLSRRRRARTPGQRIDDAIRALASIPTAPAAALDSDRVQGGETSQAGPAYNGDPAGGAKRDAERLAERLEQRLDDMRGANRLHGHNDQQAAA